MPSLNKVILIGRLTRDPEKRYTSSNLAITTFSVAVDRPFKDQQTGERKTDFFRCKAWRQKADFIAEYGAKGRLVAVEGRIEISEGVGQDGQKRFFTDIVCDNVELLESTRDGAGDGASGGGDFNGGGARNGASGGYDNGGGSGGDDSNGYFADDEPAPARAPQRSAPAAPARQAPAPRQAAPAAPPQRPAGGAGGRAPARAPEPAYPADDFDDSDPFADE